MKTQLSILIQQFIILRISIWENNATMNFIRYSLRMFEKFVLRSFFQAANIGITTFGYRDDDMPRSKRKRNV